MMTRQRRMMAVVKTVFILTAVISVLHLLSCPPVASYELSSRRSESLHRFRSLDRIRNRLDGGSNSNNNNNNGQSVLSTSSKESGSMGPGHHQGTYTTGSNSILAGGLGNGTLDYRHRESTSSRLSSEPKDFSDVDNDDDDDDDDDSYENEDDSELLADKTPWRGYSYKHSYSRPKNVPTTTSTTTTTTTTTTPPPPSISYSQYKWQHLGTRQGVEQYRRNTVSSSSNTQRHHHHHHGSNNNNNHHHSNNNNRAQSVTPDTSIREAINHAVKVSREGSCGVPKPRLVRVQDFYPHPGKTYVPHCTILHQCLDETGCCRHEVLTCSPKTTQRVELAFYTITMDSSRGSTVERLVFYNHTECECRDRMEDLMPRDVSAVSQTTGTSSSSFTPKGTNNRNSLDPLASHQYHTTAEQQQHKSSQCKCSSAYAERVLPDGSCSCDCFDKQKDCLRLKRGKDFFSMQDKWCIQTGRCEVPECAYGSYVHLAGRCPRKKERFSPPLSWHRYLTQ